MRATEHADEPAKTWGRLDWVDAVRGASVFAVVLFHIIIVTFEEPAGAIESTWVLVGSFLGAFRMPLLLLISGFLVAGRLAAGWGDRRNVRRVVGLLYLYVVWLTVYTLLSLLPVLHLVNSPWDFLRQLLLPNTPLWFLWALALYTALLLSVRKLPMQVVLPVIALVSLGGSLVFEGEFWARIPYYFVFFALGAYGKKAIAHAVSINTIWRTAVVVAIFVAFFALQQVAGDVPLLGSAARLARDVAGAATGVLCIAALSRIAVVRRPLSALGRRTLGVYVMHVPIVFGVVPLLLTLPVFGNPVVSAIFPLAFAVLTVAVCIGVESLAMNAPLRVFFALPASMLRLQPTGR